MAIGRDPYKLVAFILMPFVIFMSSIINYRNRESSFYFILFSVLFGATFIFVEGSDSTRMILLIDQTSMLRWSDFYSFVFEQSRSDYFFAILSFLVGKIYPGPNFLYAILAFIYSSFFVLTVKKIIVYLQKYEISKIGFISGIYLILILLVTRASAFNGARYWTAVFIFTYSVFCILENRKNIKGYLWLLSTMFIHFSFAFGVAIVAVYLLIGRVKLACYIFCIVSFVSSFSLKDFLNNNLGKYMNETVEVKYSVYSRDGNLEAAEDRKATRTWYFAYGSEFATNGAIAVLLASLLIKTRRKDEEDLFYFLIIYLSFLNLSSFANVFFMRFGWVFTFLVACYMFRLSLYYKKWLMKLLAWTMLISCIPLIILNIRTIMFFVDISMFLPLFLMPFVSGVFSIGDIVDTLFR